MFVAIVDYGMGNVRSVQNACMFVGIESKIISDPEEIQRASGIILPGVGAFGIAMANLESLNLTSVLKEKGKSQTPIMGICLGMQLLMTRSDEFGSHKGLDIIPGEVTRLISSGEDKVPNIGWNRIYKKNRDIWQKSLLKNVTNQAFMYFVHSYFVKPNDGSIVASTSRFADNEFCSTLCIDNIFACQYHPERSGSEGLKIYAEFKKKTSNKK